MTAPRKKPTRQERQRETEKKQRKFARSPCDRPPIVPTNLFSRFDRLGVPRYHRLRALFRWDEVHEDTSGFILAIRHYQLDLEYSAQDAPGTWFDAERYMVPPKDDNEPNDKVHFIVKGSIVANLAYRWRVRAVARGGCKSDWTEWQYMADAGGDNPPAPLQVKVYQNAIDRIVVDWDHAPDIDDDELLDERVAHYGCEISQHQSFKDAQNDPSIYKRDIFVHGTQRTFKITEADVQGTQFFARAWSVGTDRDKSAKIPAKLNGNNDPFAQADGVTVDLPSQAKFPPGVVHHWPGPLGKIPAGWLHCNGDHYSTTVYAELFAAIGYRFDQTLAGSGQFAVPDYRKRQLKGAGSAELEGDVDDGYGYALPENQREDKHGKHPRHKHMHHHRNRRRDHDGSGDGNTDGGNGDHNHNLVTWAGGVIVGGGDATVDRSTGGATTAGPNHSHSISGQTGPGGSAHSHSGIGGGKIQSTKSKQLYGIGGVSPITGEVPAHTDHFDFAVFADHGGSVWDDSIGGGVRAADGMTWDGGETTSGGSFTTVDEDPVVAAQNKGHRHHPHAKGHFIIKT